VKMTWGLGVESEVGKVLQAAMQSGLVWCYGFSGALKVPVLET
jgi:hypothetical protein